MNRNILFSLALLAWFVALALVEAAVSRHSRRSERSTSDARLVTNFGFAALLLIAGAVPPLANVAAAASSRGLHMGLASRIAIPWLALLALTLTVQTFASYWAHRLMHQNRLLWRIHRVHHADSAVDVSTSLRNHPLELFVTVPTAGLVTLAIGAPLSVVTASSTIFVGATIWEHAEISLPPRMERMLSSLILTPRLHRLHHNPERAIHDSNFGTLFTAWDRLFGTLCEIKERKKVGLDDERVRPDHFVDQIRSPLLPA